MKKVICGAPGPLSVEIVSMVVRIWDQEGKTPVPDSIGGLAIHDASSVLAWHASFGVVSVSMLTRRREDQE